MKTYIPEVELQGNMRSVSDLNAKSRKTVITGNWALVRWLPVRATNRTLGV
jgi:hypothetical protein